MRTAPHHAAPGTAAGRRSSARSSRIAAVLAAGLLLPGCTLIGSLSPGSWEPDPEAWVHDESAGRYYQLAALSDDPARWAEEFPQYADSPGTWIAGRFSDPGERVTIPGPDDYWEQMVLVVGPEEVSRLLEDSGEQTLPHPTEDTALRERIVAPLEGELPLCESGWRGVGVVEPDPSHSPTTPTGMGTDLALACAGGDRIVVSTFEM